MNANVPDAMGRPDWITDQLIHVPSVVLELHAMIPPASQAAGTTEWSSGGSAHSTPPLNVMPIDEADELWAVLWELVDELVESTRPCFHVLHEVDRIRRRQHLAVHAGVEVVRGFRTTERDMVDAYTRAVVQWLIARASTLAYGYRFPAAIDELADRIARLRSLVGGGFRTYRSWPCRTCGHHAILPRWAEDRSRCVGFLCENCEEYYPVGGSDRAA